LKSVGAATAAALLSMGHSPKRWVHDHRPLLEFLSNPETPRKFPGLSSLAALLLIISASLVAVEVGRGPDGGRAWRASAG
jgi:hypothetical protein